MKQDTEFANPFSDFEKQGLYRAIYERRDIRREFLPTPIPREAIYKILNAAHHAGSVGFMQPWNFVVIEEDAIKLKVKKLFEDANQKAAENYTDEKKSLYSSLKLEGIMDAPVNVCVTCDTTRGGEHVLGRNTIRETDVFSTCCAIQNLWLAARAEEIGVGWVSILDPVQLKEILGIPSHVLPIAYLCLGYVSHFPKIPMLEEVKWEKRRPLEELVYSNQWDQPYFPK